MTLDFPEPGPPAINTALNLGDGLPVVLGLL